MKFSYCQSEIEERVKCKTQCEHCAEYYKPIEEEQVKCNICNGDGYTAEHDPSDPHEGGQCNHCPIQVQCENCQGTGFKESKKYSVIYADPPWKVKAGRPMNGYKIVDGVQIWNSIDNKSRDLNFNSMTLDEIKAMPIKEIAADNSHLYLWVTNGYLPLAFDVIKDWGFKYSTTLVWAKNAMGGGLGGNYRITTEFLLFCTRGSLKAKKKHTGTWFNEKRRYENGSPCHSAKPDFFHQLIEKVSPGPYLELFARRERKGWDVFGNEVENSIVLLKNELPCGVGEKNRN